MEYNVDINREIDPTQISIANSEMLSTLKLIQSSRDNEVKFHELVRYALQLQSALIEIECRLKRDIDL